MSSTHLKMFTPLLLITLVGCKSTGVIPMSQDSYLIGKKDGSPGVGISLSNKAEVYQEANAYCEQKGMEVMVLRENIIPAAPGRLGSTELNFKCVQSGGSAQALRKDSDIVVDVNIKQNPSSSVPKEDYYLELKKLKDLLDSEIITQDEFDKRKKEILERN